MFNLIFSIIALLIFTYTSFIVIVPSMAHEVFTDPFTIEYIIDYRKADPEITIINYDSETNIFKIQKKFGINHLNREIKLTEDQEHVIEHKFGDSTTNILNLNMTHSFCLNPSFVKNIQLKLKHQLNSSNRLGRQILNRVPVV